MLKILINNEEVVCSKNIKITKDILTASSVILNNVYPKEWENDGDYVSRFYFPKDYSICKIYNDDILEFVGLTKNSGNISLNPFQPKFVSLQVLDFKTFLSEGITLDIVLTNITIKEAIEKIVNEISSYGFTIGNIELDEADEIIGNYNTFNQTAFDVFQYIAEITEAKWFVRTINETTSAIDFYDIEKLPIKENIEYTNEYFENNSIVDINYNYSTRDYRNKQTILSDIVVGNIEIDEQFVVNENDVFVLSTNIAILNEIKVNGVIVPFATFDAKKIGVYADFYYNTNTNTIESREQYPNGTFIEVNFIPAVKGRQTVFEQDEIMRLEEQMDRNGVISRYEIRNDVLSSEELLRVAQTYLKYKGKLDINLNIKTFNKNIFELGDQVYFNMPQLNALSQFYMVKNIVIEKNVVGNEEQIFYNYTLSSTYLSEKAINYFDNQRRKTNGNIAAGQFISRNIDLNFSSNIIFSDLNISEIVIENNNILEAELESGLTD